MKQKELLKIADGLIIDLYQFTILILSDGNEEECDLEHKLKCEKYLAERGYDYSKL
jgi:hypothetical protein